MFYRTIKYPDLLYSKNYIVSQLKPNLFRLWDRNKKCLISKDFSSIDKVKEYVKNKKT